AAAVAAAVLVLPSEPVTATTRVRRKTRRRHAQAAGYAIGHASREPTAWRRKARVVQAAASQPFVEPRRLTMDPLAAARLTRLLDLHGEQIAEAAGPVPARLDRLERDHQRAGQPLAGAGAQMKEHVEHAQRAGRDQQPAAVEHPEAGAGEVAAQLPGAERSLGRVGV